MMIKVMSIDISLIDADWPYSKAKTAVLIAAAGVIREQGPRAATLKNIAHRAGITEPAIFRHFEGVDGLFQGLFSVYERIYGRIIAVHRNEGGTLDGFRSAVHAATEVMAASRDFAYLVLNADQVFSGYPELKARSREMRSHDERFAMESLERARAKGEIRADATSESVAFAAMGILHITTVMWLDSEFSFDLCGLCDRRLEEFLRLVRAP
jgi:AcrR family transcriptional regulator